jgi:uncharacterized SAM-binding protein YcdF (DUF218 family)
MTDNVPPGVATNLIVFGRGLRKDGSTGEVSLTEPARARVVAAHRYIADHASTFIRCDREGVRGRIVFSGGWPGAAAGMAPPPVEQREGALMQAYFAELGEVPPLDVQVETRSDSTLENALCVQEEGCFADRSFGPGNPLGLVAHEGHLARVDYFIRKVLRLPADAVLPVPAAGPDTFAAVPERQALLMARFVCFGARTPQALRRRHRWLVNAGQWLARPRRQVLLARRE